MRITLSQWASTSGSWLTSSRVGPGEGEPLLQHLGRDDGVECRERVVQQQNVGLGVEGAGQGDPLLLAAGEAGAELPTSV